MVLTARDTQAKSYHVHTHDFTGDFQFVLAQQNHNLAITDFANLEFDSLKNDVVHVKITQIIRR